MNDLIIIGAGGAALGLAIRAAIEIFKDKAQRKERPRFEPKPEAPILYKAIPHELPTPHLHFEIRRDPEALQSPKSRKNRKAMRAAKQRRLTLKKQPK